jgi:hypothetical protein
MLECGNAGFDPQETLDVHCAMVLMSTVRGLAASILHAETLRIWTGEATRVH